MSAEVDGQITIMPDDTIPIPAKFHDQRIVIRSTDATHVYHKSSTIFYAAENDLEPGIIQIKPFGGEPELYEVLTADGERYDPYEEVTE